MLEGIVGMCISHMYTCMHNILHVPHCSGCKKGMDGTVN